jgi:phosphoribosylformylglycinamidine synthase
MVGGRIGKDGIHGATFSSEELHKDSPVQAVQIGDPITQKKMSDLLLEARDSGLYNAITDNGAGGLSSSIGEMATLCGGCEIWLEKAPLKYAGLDPWEILLSEAQERMTLAVPPSTIESFLDLAERRDVDATVIGKFTDSGHFHAKYGDRTVALVDMKFLHEGVPQKTLKATWRQKPPEYSEIAEPENCETTLKEMLARLNICSIEYKLRQYDHEVKGISVIKPLLGKEHDCPSDATVSILEYDSREGLIVSEGICPYYSDIDTYCMAQSAVDEAVRRIMATGGRLQGRGSLLSILDNFCWSDPEPSETNPDAEYKMAQLVRACKGLHDYAVYMGIPLISGKDSMKNDSVIEGVRVSIPQTLMITGIAKIVDIEKAVTMDVKQVGDTVYVLGLTASELGGSEFSRYLGEKNRGTSSISGNVPSVNPELAKPLYVALARAIDAGLVNSAHTLTIGGLGVGLSLIAFGGMLGLEIHLNKVPTETGLSNHEILFSESNGRFLVTVPREKLEAFETQMQDTTFARLGEVTEDERLRILDSSDRVIVDSDLRELKESWRAPLRGI